MAGLLRTLALSALAAVSSSPLARAAPCSHGNGTTPAAPDVSACKLPAIQSVYLSSGHGYSLSCAPSTGTLRGQMIFVDFPDAPASASESPAALYGFFMPGAAQWYANASHGRLALDIQADTSRFYRMPAASTSYGWARGLTAEAHLAYIQDALAAYGNAKASALTSDVLYVVPTRNAKAITFTPTYMTPFGPRGSSTSTVVAKKAVTVGQDAFDTWGYKVINHETGHCMCLPDLYPLPSGATGQYVGGWDMMGLISGPSPDYFAWDQWRLGWLGDDSIACVSGSGSTRHVLAPLEGATASGKPQAVVIKRNGTDVLVAEARTAQGVDAASCATGVLLYTVSTATETGKGPIRVLDTRPGSGGCAGDELNDAPLSTAGQSYTVPGWGVKVTLTGKQADGYAIEVTVP